MSEKLVADTLRKSFAGREVVRGVSLEVARGEVVGLLGPNGAGKTTSFHLILGLVSPDSGTVHLTGDDITGLPMYLRARRGVGYLPQEPSIFRRMTVEENLLAILETLALSAPERRDRAAELMQELGIGHLAQQMAYSLSGGERRRAEIARALVSGPSFMLLDEPFSGIDPIAVSDIQRVIGYLKQKGIGILITDHNVRETLQITDRAYIINEGQIFRKGTPESLASDQRVREVYLGENFSLN